MSHSKVWMVIIAMLVFCSASVIADNQPAAQVSSVQGRIVSGDDISNDALATPRKLVTTKTVSGKTPISKAALKNKPMPLSQTVKTGLRPFITNRSLLEKFDKYNFNIIHPNPYVPGEIVVQLWDKARPYVKLNVDKGIASFGIPEIDNLNRKYRTTNIVRVLDERKLTDADRKYRLDLIFRVIIGQGTNMEQVAAEYRNVPNVKGASPNYIPQIAGVTYGDEAKNVSRAYSDDPLRDWTTNTSGAAELFASGATPWATAQNDTILVIDVNGFATTHPDLATNLVGSGGTGVVNTAAGQHGTECLGNCSARNNNAAGIIGTGGGWNTTRGLSTLVYTFTSHAENITGINWATSGTNRACVLSQSSMYTNEPAGLEDAIQAVYDNQGVVMFAAAGNSGESDNIWPAFFNCVVSVAGTARNDEAATFTTHNDKVGMSAPGDEANIFDGLTYTWGAGTSFATPRAAGLAGMIVNKYNVRGQALKDHYFRTSDDINFLTPDWQNSLGTGRMNMYEALNAYDINVAVSSIGADRADGNPFINPYNVFNDWAAGDSLSYLMSKEFVPYTPIIPKARISNKGKTPVSVNATCAIDSAGVNVYRQTEFVPGILTGKSKQVYFPQFMPKGVGVNYTFKVYTDLAGDGNRTNDTMSFTTATSYTDTMQNDIGSGLEQYANDSTWWAVRYVPANPCSVAAVQFQVFNRAMNTTTFAWSNQASACSVGVWLENPATGLPGTRVGAAVTATFGGDRWYTHTLATKLYVTGPFWVGVWTLGSWTAAAQPRSRYSMVYMDPWHLNGNSAMKKFNAANFSQIDEDYMVRPVVIYPAFNATDYQVSSIDEPSEYLAKDTMQVYIDAPYIPKATIKNAGTVGQTNVNVTCTIDSAGTLVYNQTRQISLAAGQQQQLIFNTPWVPKYTKNYCTMKIKSGLAGDQRASNDSIQVKVYATNETLLKRNVLNTGLGTLTGYAANDYSCFVPRPAAACSIIGARIMLNNLTAARACTLWVGPDSLTAAARHSPVKPWPQPKGNMWIEKVVSFTAADNGKWKTIYFTGATGDSIAKYLATPQSFHVALFTPTADCGICYDVPPVYSDAEGVFCLNNDPHAGWGWTYSFGGGAAVFAMQAIVKYLDVPLAYDAEIKSIDNPQLYVYPNVVTSPKVTVGNAGMSTTSNPINVTFRIDTSHVQVYTSTKTVAAGLLPGTSTQVTFDPFTATVVGKNYEDSVSLTMTGDGDASNNMVKDSVNCTPRDVINYLDGTYNEGIITGHDPYLATRFTADQPCSLVAVLGYMQDTTTAGSGWALGCSTFVWQGRGDGRKWPGTMRYSDYWDSASGGHLKGGFAYNIRRNLPTPQFFNAGQDFWIGFRVPYTGKSQPDLVFGYPSQYGRSYSDSIPRDSTFWWPFTLTGDTAAEWEIQAVVKYMGSKFIQGPVANAKVPSACTFRSYITKNADYNVTQLDEGSALLTAPGDSMIWQTAPTAYASFTTRDTLITIIECDTGSTNATRTGFFALTNDTFQIAQTLNVPSCVLREIPIPTFQMVTPSTNGWIKWTKPATDGGRLGLTTDQLITGFEVWMDSSQISSWTPDPSKFEKLIPGVGGVGASILIAPSGRCSLYYYPTTAAYFRFAVKLELKGWTASKGPNLVTTGMARYTNATNLGGALSVEMSQFAATIASARSVTINWRTESENETYKWTVERSDQADGPFVIVGRLDAFGMTQVAHDYSYTDDNLEGGKVYYYRLGQIDLNTPGLAQYYGPISVGPLKGKPLFNALEQARPNPFHANTTIYYQLNAPGQVAIRIYNIAGQLVRTLVDKQQKADYYGVPWDGCNDRGVKVATGLYLYKMEVNDYHSLKKMMFIR